MQGSKCKLSENVIDFKWRNGGRPLQFKSGRLVVLLSPVRPALSAIEPVTGLHFLKANILLDGWRILVDCRSVEGKAVSLENDLA